ncbi:hypothetical protein GCM10023238_22630 [Streptomyces heliomycini]
MRFMAPTNGGHEHVLDGSHAVVLSRPDGVAGDDPPMRPGRDGDHSGYDRARLAFGQAGTAPDTPRGCAAGCYRMRSDGRRSRGRSHGLTGRPDPDTGLRH